MQSKTQTKLFLVHCLIAVTIKITLASSAIKKHIPALQYSCFQWENLSEKEICGELVDSNGKSVSIRCRKNQAGPNSRNIDFDDFGATFHSLESNSKDCRNFYEADSKHSFRYNCIQSERPSEKEVCRTLVDELIYEPVWTMCLKERRKTQNSNDDSSPEIPLPAFRYNWEYCKENQLCRSLVHGSTQKSIRKLGLDPNALRYQHFEWTISTKGAILSRVVDLFTKKRFCESGIMGQRPPSVIGSMEDYEDEDDENRDTDLYGRIETRKSGVGR